MMITGTSWHTGKPLNPVEGDCYVDGLTNTGFIRHKGEWVVFSNGDNHSERFVPTLEELERHPALKQAWQEYLIIKRLVGV
jgi:hypothetical protein